LSSSAWNAALVAFELSKISKIAAALSSAVIRLITTNRSKGAGHRPFAAGATRAQAALALLERWRADASRAQSPP
jgi:hypothetical protein